MFLKRMAAQYYPEVALVVFKLRNGKGLNLPSVYLESYEFHRDNQSGAYELGNGQPLTKKTLEELARFLRKRKTKERKVFTFESKRIPSHILYAGQVNSCRRVCWYLRKPKRTLYFADELNLPNGEVELPNLVFSYDNTGLSVYAYRDPELQGNTPLYHAPFHNTSDGTVCMGTAKIQVRSHYWEDLVQAAEKAFFQSEFTHMNGENPIKGNLNLVYDRCIRQQQPFPQDVLLPMSKTLNDIL